MSDYQERVKEELKALNTKRDSLALFEATDLFASLPEDDKKLLELQAVLMEGYALVLTQRIWRFK